MNQSELTNSILDQVRVDDQELPPGRKLFRTDPSNINVLLGDAVMAVDKAVSKLLDGHIVSLQRVRARSYRLLFDDGEICSEVVVQCTHSAAFLGRRAFLIGAERVGERLVAALAAAAAVRFATAS